MAEITTEELLQVYRAHLGAGQVPDRIAEEWLRRAESWDTALDAARAYEEQARWRVLPVSPQEFIESPRYLNLKDEVWPAIMDCLVEAVTGAYLEMILTGCVHQDAMVICGDGALPRLGALVGKSTTLAVLDDAGHGRFARSQDGVDSGIRPVWELVLTNGMRVILTPEHRVMTARGWVETRHLNPSMDWVCVARRIVTMPSCLDLRDEEVKLLAYFLTDGSSDRYRMRYVDGRRETGQEVAESLRAIGFAATDPYLKKGAWEVHSIKFVRSGLRAWMQHYGIHDVRTSSSQVMVPDVICRAPNAQVALFLNRVWAAEGTVYAGSEVSPPRFILAMKSETFIRQVQLLLLRFGIQGRVWRTSAKRNDTMCTWWSVSVSGKESLERFVAAIGPIFSKEIETEALLARIAGKSANTNVDVVPMTWGDADRLLTANGVTRARGNEWWRLAVQRSRHMSRTMFVRFVAAFGHVPAIAELAARYPDDQGYVRIKVLREMPVALPVADIGVPSTGSFLAGGIQVHNSVGWGKSFLADLLEAYTLYELTCMASPQVTLGLATGTAAVIVLQSITERLAQRVLFSPLRALVRQSPWFRQVGLDLRLRTQLVLPGPVRVTPVAGHEQAAIGENVVGAVLDEAGFMAVVEKSKRTRGVDEVYDVAMRNYQALQRRMKSRFLNRGRLPCRLIVVSQVRYVDDFTDRKIQEAKDDPSILVLCKSTWETKPASRFLGPKFRVAVGTALKRARVLAESEQVPEGQRVIEAPVEFAADFTKDPDGACRDIAGIATSAITPFITRRELIAQAIDPKRKHPFDRLVTTLRDGLQIVPGRLDTQVRAPRAVHLDLAVSGDAAGLGMVYCAGLKRVTRTSFEVSQADGTGRELVEEPENGQRVYAEYLPVFVLEAVLRIVPPPGDEITLTDVMDLVLRLREFVPITYLSADQFQSVSARQTARERGMIAGEVSVDRTPKPYLDLRDALYDGRLRLYDYVPLISELLALERSERTGKCDHPAWMRDTEGKRVRGSKDVADSAAAAVHVLARRPDAWGTQHVDAEPSRVEVGPRGMLRGTVTLGG